MRFFKKNSASGYTIIEIAVSLFVISVGLLGAFALLQGAIGPSATASSQLIAIYLAQEGIEIVGNIRESNYVEIHRGNALVTWTSNGLDNCSNGCKALYAGPALSPISPNDPLLRDSSGFYNYSSGTPTKFSRVIFITIIDPDGIPNTGDEYLNVSSRVEWQERGKIYNTTIKKLFYNWL